MFYNRFRRVNRHRYDHSLFLLFVQSLILLLVNIVLSMQQNKRLHFSSPMIAFFSKKLFAEYFLLSENRPCRNVRMLLNDRLIPGFKNCSETCLAIYERGRFGNQYYSFAGSIVIAKSSGIKTIIIPQGFLMMNKSFWYEDIYFKVSNNTKGCIYTDTFAIPKYLRKKALHYRLSLKFRSFFMSKFPNISLSNSTLVVHVRSGDVFTLNGINRNYGQPPCRYYLDIIHMKKWRNVILVSENTANPCVKIISKVVGPYKKRTFYEDLAIMLNARNFVLSEGTIGYSVVALSNKIQNVYTFVKWFDRSHPNLYYVNVNNCVPSFLYFIFVLKFWKNCKFQKKYIMKSKCVTWKFYNKSF